MIYIIKLKDFQRNIYRRDFRQKINMIRYMILYDSIFHPR